jgi:lipid-A-disaccharide synthase
MKAADNSSGISFFISAGEQSGDMHGAELVKELRAVFLPAALSITGLGGDLMANEGMRQLYHIKDLATVGFIDVIKKYSFFKNAIDHCALNILAANPDAVILIDYPGFNLRLAEAIRKSYKGKIIYYISPQLWAWHESRVKQVKKCVDLMLVVFPFEVDFYSKHSISAMYVGHPLTKRIKNFLDSRPPAARTAAETKRITVMPGSRKDEIRKHLPVLIEALKMLGDEIKIDVKFRVAPGMDDVYGEFKEELKEYSLTKENSYDLIFDSDAVLTKAGTSTMECSLMGTPYLIFYKTSPINYYLLKPIVKVDYLGIINILAGEEIIKEFVQNEFNARNIYQETKKILSDSEYSRSISSKLEKVWEILGNKDASRIAAQYIKEMVE